MLKGTLLALFLLLLDPATGQARPVEIGLKANSDKTITISLGSMDGQVPTPPVLASVRFVIAWYRGTANMALPVTGKLGALQLNDVSIRLPVFRFEVMMENEKIAHVQLEMCRVQVKESSLLSCPIIFLLRRTADDWAVEGVYLP